MKRSGGCWLLPVGHLNCGWVACGYIFRVTCGTHGVPSVIRQGLLRGPLTTPEAWRDGRQKPCCAQGRPLHASFLLNALYRISLICASLWFESQKEGGRKRKHNSVCHLSKTEKRRQWASDVLAGAPRAWCGHRAEAVQRSTPGPSLAFGGFASAVGDADRLCGGF